MDLVLILQLDWLSIKHSFIDVSFQAEHYPWIQVHCVLRSISKRHAGGHSQTENKGATLDCNAFSFFPSLHLSLLHLFQPVCAPGAAAHFWSIVVCLCQMPKRLQNEEGHMKRGWVTVVRVCNHTHTKTVNTQSTGSLCQRLFSIILSFIKTQDPELSTPSLETQVSGGGWRHGWDLIETALNYRIVTGETDKLSAMCFKIDEPLNWLHYARLKCVCVCVFLGW